MSVCVYVCVRERERERERERAGLVCPTQCTPYTEGDLPLDIAARDGHTDVVTLLLAHAPALRTHTRALREATRTGRKDVVRLLLDQGMDCTAADPDSGDTALHIACRFVRLECAEHLLAFGADAHAVNARDETPALMVDGYPGGDRKTRMLKMIADYKEKEVLVPAIVLDQRQQRKYGSGGGASGGGGGCCCCGGGGGINVATTLTMLLCLLFQSFIYSILI